MSLHLYSESGMTESPRPTNIHSTFMDDSSDTESPPSAVIDKLREELKRERTELAKAKKEKKELSTQLLQAQDERVLTERKHDGAFKELHKANCKINELEALCDKREGEVAELKASLDAVFAREWRLNERLESSEKECSQLNLEKYELKERNAYLEEEVRKWEQRTHCVEQLLAELEQLRMNNLNLKRDLVAARDREHISSSGIADEDESPERMIFDQFGSNQRLDGMNLRQELSMLGNPLISTFSQSCQFPSSDDIVEGHVEWAPVMNAASQTERILVADSFTQVEVLPARMIFDQTRGVPRSNSSAQTDSLPSKSFTTAFTQTVTSIQGNGLMTNNGITAALQPYHVPYESQGNPSVFSQSMFPPSSEPNLAGGSKRFWWIWIMAILCFIIAYVGNGGLINISPLVNSCRNGLNFHYKKGFPPH